MRKLFAWLGVAMLTVFLSPDARAGEPLKPYVVLVLDTSGSMGNATNSGPPSCGGTDTRLNHAKCAIRKIVNSYGDMVFALGRFRMTMSGTTTADTFPTGCSSSGPGNVGSATCNATSDMFELLTPLVDGNNDASDAWVNLTGNTCTAVGTDPEIWRANGNTPLAGSLNGAKSYWTGIELSSPSNFTIWPTSEPGFAPISTDPTRDAFLPKAGKPIDCNPNAATCDNSDSCTTNCCCESQCRPYITILLTDGEETCAPSPTVPPLTSTAPTVTLAPTSPASTQIGDLVIVTTWSVNTNAAVPTHTVNVAGGFETIQTQTLVNTATSARLSVAFKIATQAGVQSYPAYTSSSGTSFSGLFVLPFGTYDLAGLSGLGSQQANNTNPPNSPTSPASPADILSAVFSIGGWLYNTATANTPTAPAGFTLLTDVAGSQVGDLAVSVATSTLNANNTTDPGAYGDNTAPVGTAAITLVVPLAAPSRIAASSLLATDINNQRYVITTKPIGFGIGVGDFDIEGIAHYGGAPDGPGNEGFYATDEAGLQLAISSILDDAIRTEKCNEIDDDCDGTADEDFVGKGNACNNGGKGVCLREGNLVCKADETGLECDAQSAACVAGRLIENGIDIGPCVELCNNIDDDCDGKVDEGLANCTCTPQAEICDGIDNDCDGRIDEASTNGPPITRPCGTGTCQGVETCNFALNCPGNPPPGTCSGFGGCTAATPTAEICDGKDNNCDGLFDGFQQACSTMNPRPPDNFPVDDPRNNAGHPDNGPINPANICHPGFKVCPAVPPPGQASNAFTTCGGEVKPCNVPTNDATPAPNPAHPNPTCFDLCNGLDDDCDNNVDEDFQPQDCSNNCNTGVTTCVNGVLGCTLTPITTDDSCDGIDDDCDGKFDEDYDCDPNTPGKQTDCPCSDALTCNGVLKCVAGVETCEGTPISSETCDCSDNNCNGQIDEGNICASGSTCSQFCQCAQPCGNTEFPCPLGKICQAENVGCQDPVQFPGCDPSDACTQNPANTNCCCRRLCITDPCFNKQCDPGPNGEAFICQVQQPDPVQAPIGVCVEACTVANCAPLICIPQTGQCAPDDCRTFPDRCSDNQNCINGVCITNPCDGKTCPSDQYCVGGNCVNSCNGVECPDGQRCRLGVCETDPCGKNCPFGQVCNDNTGECVDNLGCGAPCPVGQWCNPNNNGGECEDDPCQISEVVCPTGEICVGGSCFDPAQFGPDGGVEVRVTAGGGGCSTGGGGSVVVGLALLVFLRRRKGGRS